MKPKIFIIIALIFFSQKFIASDNLEDDSRSEVATQVDEYSAIGFDLPEVSVSSSLSTQLCQLFTHDSQVYKNIEFGEFFKHYSTVVAGFIDQAQAESQLTEEEQLHVESAQIVGDRPLWHDEQLFSCSKARNVVVQLVKEFIDGREEEVRNNCISHILQERASRVVWAPYCCGIQLHKHCFNECKKSKVDRCLNSFCSNPAWTQAFYARVARERKTVRFDNIFDANCPVCFDPLKSVNITSVGKRPAEEEVVASNSSFLGKKKRFL